MDNEQSVQPTPRTNTGPQPVEITPVPTARLHSELRPEPTCRVESDAGLVIFEILVATMWSDGELVKAEVERGRVVAELLGLRPRGGGAFTAIANGPLPFSDLGFDQLGPNDARLAYAAAEWLASVNDEPSTRRSGFLRALAMRMRIEQPEIEYLHSIVEELPADERAAFLSLLEDLLPTAAAAS